MDPKDFALAEAEGRINGSRRLMDAAEASLRAAQQERANLLAAFQYNPAPVAPHYRSALLVMPLDEVLSQARDYARWLANKQHQRGLGAAADSGESCICALLEHLADRLEA